MRKRNWRNCLPNWEGLERSGLFLAFFLPFLVMLLLFVANGIYPFGNRSFLFSDMYHQYMPFFSEFMRKIKAGEGLGYSWNVGLGSNFLALYVYYLASPLHWLSFLFPEKHLMEFMSYLVTVKIGLCGLSSCFYFRRHFRTKDLSVLFFSTFYALSGYMAAYNWNIMWLDVVVLAPLVLLGLEQLVREGRGGLYCATLSLSIFTNYYLSILLCVFLVFYFLFLLLTAGEYGGEDGLTGSRAKKGEGPPVGSAAGSDAGQDKRASAGFAAGSRAGKSAAACFRFVGCSVLAAGMAAVLLIPEVCAIWRTDFGSSDFPQKLEAYFPVLDMLARHCVGVATERGLEHWPNLYCGAAVFLLLPLYVLNDGIPVRQRFGRLALAGLFLFGFATNIADFIWHGWNYPDSLPARQSFLYILVVLTMCLEAFRQIGRTEKKRILHGYLAAAVFLLFCEKFTDSEDFPVEAELVTLLLAAGYAILLYLYRSRAGDEDGAEPGGEEPDGAGAALEKRGKPPEKTAVRRWKQRLGFIAMAAVLGEASVNMYHTSVGTTSRSAYLDQQADYLALLAETTEKINSEEKAFFRIEKFTRKTKNDGTLTGYPTASVFSSTMNSDVARLYQKWGMRHSKVYYGFDGATAFTSALLNVRYLFDAAEETNPRPAAKESPPAQEPVRERIAEGSGRESAPEPEAFWRGKAGPLYELRRVSGDVALYESKAALPFGYVAPEGYQLPEGYQDEPIKLQNRMVRDLGISEDLFRSVGPVQSGEEVFLTADATGYYYAVTPSSGTSKITADFPRADRRKGSVLSGTETREYADLKKASVLSLGYLEEGETVILRNGDEEDETPEIKLQAYRMEQEVLEEALAALSREHLTEVAYDSTHISGGIRMSRSGRLILSVPYETGWSITVDGETAQPVLFGGTLIALDLEAGYHTLEMTYVPEGKYAGILVSVAGWLVGAGILLRWKSGRGAQNHGNSS
ncbi:MAG: YfhO family protein [Clostridium sp.]|jgi:uncharacterized membrane protein YfhO|nr:YfhO family protein [Clostridium sp.]